MKTYTGKGHIAGLLNGNLFSDFEAKWRWNTYATIKFETSERTFSLIFSYEGYEYSILGKESKPTYYVGSFYNNRETLGKIFFWTYTNNKGCIITGGQDEDGHSYEL